jgi:hypothetical protein
VRARLDWEKIHFGSVALQELQFEMRKRHPRTAHSTKMQLEIVLRKKCCCNIYTKRNDILAEVNQGKIHLDKVQAKNIKLAAKSCACKRRRGYETDRQSVPEIGYLNRPIFLVDMSNPKP